MSAFRKNVVGYSILGVVVTPQVALLGLMLVECPLLVCVVVLSLSVVMFVVCSLCSCVSPVLCPFLLV